MVVEPNEKPLDKRTLEELIRFSGYAADLILQYDPGHSGHYLVYAKYHQNQIVRQVYTQRKQPRRFKDLRRAIEWGKKIGFRSMTLNMDYSVYPDPVEEN